MQVRQVRVERARRLLRAVADGGGQPSAKRWPHARSSSATRSLCAACSSGRAAAGDTARRARRSRRAHPPGPLVRSERGRRRLEGAFVVRDVASGNAIPVLSNRETSFFSPGRRIGTSVGAPHPLSTSRNRTNACMRVMSRAVEYSSAAGDGRVVPPRVKLERHRQDILRRVHQRRRRVGARAAAGPRASPCAREGAGMHAGTSTEPGAATGRARRNTRPGRPGCRVPERAHALRVGEMPEHQRHAQVRRRQVREQKLALAGRPQQPVEGWQVGEVQHVLLGVHAFAGEVARVAAGGRAPRARVARAEQRRQEAAAQRRCATRAGAAFVAGVALLPGCTSSFRAKAVRFGTPRPACTSRRAPRPAGATGGARAARPRWGSSAP